MRTQQLVSGIEHAGDIVRLSAQAWASGATAEEWSAKVLTPLKAQNKPHTAEILEVLWEQPIATEAQPKPAAYFCGQS